MKIPKHVSIIMDGNGRWAKSQGQDRVFGHNVGTDSVRACLEFAIEKGIDYISLFAFSEENWNRPKSEIEALMALMVSSILEEKETFRKNNIRFKVMGNRERYSEVLLKEVELAEQETANNTGLTFIIFLSYSGKWDILNAVKLYSDYKANNHEDVPLSEEVFASFLSTAGIPDPDLIIRTSGEQRISNYLLWQAAYSEFYFTPTLWPDFRKNQFQDALDSFNARERRFGLTGDQLNQ